MAECDHEEAITLCVCCGATLPRIDDEIMRKAKGLFAKAQKVKVACEVMVVERNMLRKTLGDAYSALKSLDLAEDGLGVFQDGPGSYWSLRDELFHAIETALGIDEEE